MTQITLLRTSLHHADDISDYAEANGVTIADAIDQLICLGFNYLSKNATG